jgi:hypothetical protein
MPFGKHKGELISDIPTEYLDWLITTVELRDWLLSAVSEELRARLDEDDEPPGRVPAGVHADVAAELVEAGRRALALRYHPDRGGDNERMSAVNATADWLEQHLGSVLPGGGKV